LLSNALIFFIYINLKFRNKIDFATFDNLMEKDGNVVYELSCLASNIKQKHCLVSSLIGCEQGKTIAKKCDNFFKFPMFFKCYNHLHPLVKSKRVLFIKGLKRITIWISLK
jgi:hypothetical protein